MKLLLFSLLLLTACTSPTNQIKPLYVYGDSISAGLDHPTNYQSIANKMGWFLVNKSIGTTSMASLNQYQLIMYDSNLWEPNAVIMLSPGLNDAILNGADPTYESNYYGWMKGIIGVIHQRGLVGYIGTPNSNCDEARFIANSITAQYAQVNRDLVQQINDPNIKLIDYNKGFVPDWGNTLDCIHPNKLGYAQMTDYFWSNK